MNAWAFAGSGTFTCHVLNLAFGSRRAAYGYGDGDETATSIAYWASANLGKGGFFYPMAETNIPSRRIAESLGGEVAGIRTNAKYTALVYEVLVAPIGCEASDDLALDAAIRFGARHGDGDFPDDSALPALIKRFEVFDAGIGSYAAISAIQQQPPRQDILYLADRASFP